MAATKSKIKEDICKWCKRAFETTPNPLVANPGAGDLLKRRCANGRDCRPCFVFIKNHDVYKEYTTSGLVDFLGEGSNQDDYNAALEEYCKGVRDGKKRTRSRGESKAVAEQSNSFATKQILGYLWPVPLLKRHERPIPKKLTTIQHQGKPLKGALLEEWVIGPSVFLD